MYNLKKIKSSSFKGDKLLFFQNLEYGILRDIFFIFRVFAVEILLYLAFQTFKKSKRGTLLSSSTGFTIFLITFALFHMLNGISVFYSDIMLIEIFEVIYISVNFTFALGMFSFIALTDIDYALHIAEKVKRKFKYPLSLFTLIILCVILPLSLFFWIMGIFTFVFIVIPFIIAGQNFMKQFENLEIAKRSKPLPWFFFGLGLAGFSNFLYNPILFETIGSWVLILNSVCVLMGGTMMTRGWTRLPPLTELDWMTKIEELLVIYLESSSLLYQYMFQKFEHEESKDIVDKDLAGSAIGGIEMLLKEVLASDSQIKQIDHGDKNIIFNHGRATICILITTEYLEEFRYRLEMFHLSFEKRYWESALKSWSGDITIFSKTDDLIRENFLQ